MNNSNHFDEEDDSLNSKKKEEKDSEQNKNENDNLQPMDKNPKVITTAEVTQIFGIKDRTVRRWRKMKKLRSFKIGQRVFFRLADVEGLMNGENQQ